MAPATRTIIVLGMHRSGTSVTTGSLEKAGLYLGEVERKGKDNLKGNRESTALYTMQEDLLNANGGAWDDPPARVRWRWRHRRARRAFIRSFKGHPLWGFKDPRTLLTLEGWLRDLPDAEFIGVFRHPVLCALSLQRRGGMPVEQGLALWTRYNARLVEIHEPRGFPIVQFVPDPAAFRAGLGRLIERLQLPGGAQGSEFFDDTLWMPASSLSPEAASETARSADLPAETRELYERLCAVEL